MLTACLLRICAGGGISIAAKGAWEAWETAALGKGPADWILLSGYNAVVKPILDLADIFTRCAMGLAARVLQRALAAAEAESDPFRIAWAAFDLGRTLATGAFQYSALCVLYDKGRAAAEACRAWVPRRLRDAAHGSSIDVAQALGVVRAQAPAERLAQPGFELSLGNYPRSWRTHPYEYTPTVRACAACGAQGVDLLRCGSCSAVWYCGKQCQRSHYVAHKGECWALAAAREAGAAAQEGEPE